jgi:hypothetical protein
MLQLTNYTAALATLLEAARAAGGGAQLELVRKESLAGGWAGADAHADAPPLRRVRGGRCWGFACRGRGRVARGGGRGGLEREPAAANNRGRSSAGSLTETPCAAPSGPPRLPRLPCELVRRKLRGGASFVTESPWRRPAVAPQSAALAQTEPAAARLLSLLPTNSPAHPRQPLTHTPTCPYTHPSTPALPPTQPPTQSSTHPQAWTPPRLPRCWHTPTAPCCP